MEINTEKYWNDGLNKDFSLTGVGDISLGSSFNKYLYKVRGFVFNKCFNYINVNTDSKILDVGVGTGFYLEQWKRKGLSGITGVDITEKSVNELSERYKEYTFRQLDIGTDFIIDDFDKFSVITAFDILFHNC